MNILVVGAGFAGAVIARELAEDGHKVCVIDQRDHIAGNAYDYTNEYGIRVHKYGPHIFHTSNEQVYEWVTKFGAFGWYYHKVKAQLADGQYVTLPVNKETKLIVGKDNIIDTFYRPYTKKMWGMELEELSDSVTKRIPVRDDDNELYFPDAKYQMMPIKGYTDLFENILNHDNIVVHVNTPFQKEMEMQYDHVFNSMAIDVYHDYCYGELPYRSLKFHHTHLPLNKVLPVGTVNFTHDGPNTRITEWKNYPYHGHNNSMTTLTTEEPCDYKDNDYQRFYPVKDINGDNQRIYKKYKDIHKYNMTFIGRCGMYVYIDMHQAINSSLAVVARYRESIK